MDMDQYQSLAARTLPPTTDGKQGFLIAALGLCGEAGEAGEHVKKWAGHGHWLDKEAFQKELGDVLWYLAAMATYAGLSLEVVARENVDKLRRRYPEGFSEAASQGRQDSALNFQGVTSSDAAHMPIVNIADPEVAVRNRRISQVQEIAKRYGMPVTQTNTVDGGTHIYANDDANPRRLVFVVPASSIEHTYFEASSGNGKDWCGIIVDDYQGLLELIPWYVGMVEEFSRNHLRVHDDDAKPPEPSMEPPPVTHRINYARHLAKIYGLTELPERRIKDAIVMPLRFSARSVDIVVPDSNKGRMLFAARPANVEGRASGAINHYAGLTDLFNWMCGYVDNLSMTYLTADLPAVDDITNHIDQAAATPLAEAVGEVEQHIEQVAPGLSKTDAELTQTAINAACCL